MVTRRLAPTFLPSPLPHDDHGGGRAGLQLSLGFGHLRNKKNAPEQAGAGGAVPARSRFCPPEANSPFRLCDPAFVCSFPCALDRAGRGSRGTEAGTPVLLRAAPLSDGLSCFGARPAWLPGSVGARSPLYLRATFLPPRLTLKSKLQFSRDHLPGVFLIK